MALPVKERFIGYTMFSLADSFIHSTSRTFFDDSEPLFTTYYQLYLLCISIKFFELELSSAIRFIIVQEVWNNQTIFSGRF